MLMQYDKLRLESFFPGLLVPPETSIPLSIGFVLLTISIYTVTWNSPPTNKFYVAWGSILRLGLAPCAIYSYLVYGFWPYETVGVGAAVGLAVIGQYGVMRVVETAYVGLIDVTPPHWIVEGKEVPLPTTISGRLAYAVDLATSLRGNSWFSKTHWDWAPKAFIDSPACRMSRAQFLWSNIISLIRQYFFLDVCDAIHKSRTWDRSNLYPITSLPWYEQVVFSVSICAQTILTITIPYTFIKCTFVSIGSHAESWPPMFNAPFTASSLADFWTQRWHAIFRRVFDRLSMTILLPIFRSSPPSLAQRTARSVVIFGLSATLHILVMHRASMLEPKYPGAFIDPSVLKFFLSQPIGLALEFLVLLPACNAFVPARWQSSVSRLWTWVFLVWVGRFWSDAWVFRGFLDEREKVVGWSVVRGVLYGKWAV